MPEAPWTQHAASIVSVFGCWCQPGEGLPGVIIAGCLQRAVRFVGWHMFAGARAVPSNDYAKSITAVHIHRNGCSLSISALSPFFPSGNSGLLIGHR